MEPLNPAEVRILGALMEKDITTPDYYPLTLNALTNACNQSSNRDPVVAYAEHAVVRGLDSLRERKLAFMFQGADSRVAKFGHRIVETLELARPETAVLCVLLLRGPQTLGEIRGRTARMHEFASLDDTEAALNALIARTPEPLVAKLPRQPGMKEQRFAQLLGGEVALPAPGTALDPLAELPAAPAQGDRLAKLESDSAALRAEVAELRRQLADLKKQLE
ncbi:MAG TPA: YceH family protein [Opitutaceae bacterium]